MRYSEKWGDSIDIAVELALQDLKLTKDQVTVTVLEEPSRGFFGIGSKLAKVRVEEKVVEKEKPVKVSVNKPEPEKKVEEKAAEAKAAPKENKAAKPKQNKKKQKNNTNNNKAVSAINIEDLAENVSKKPEDLKEANDHPAQLFLEQLTQEMGVDVTVKTFVNADSVYVDIEGKDTGTVIGKRGATLDAVQYLTSLVINKGENEYIRVIVDAEGYREKREATLKKLAVKLAEKAIKTGKSVRLEPMNPYERKVIHTVLQNVPSVTTKSEGEEPFRKVVILPAKH